MKGDFVKMATKVTPVLEQLEEQLSEWTDGRIVSAEDISIWYRFNVYLVNLLDPADLEYRGHSFKNSQPLNLLVVKLTLEKTPYVVFVSGRTPTACMKIFLTRLEEGTLELRPDRFG